MLSQKGLPERILKALAEGSRQYEAMPKGSKRTFLPYKLRWAMDEALALEAPESPCKDRYGEEPENSP